jgi:hypothetical protein
LIVETQNIRAEQNSEIQFLLHTNTPRPDPGVDPVPWSVRVHTERRGGFLTIDALTPLGDAGSITLSVKEYEEVSLRIVLSARERPEGAEQWTPQGDVLIKVRISDTSSGTDVLEQLDRNRWLNINCVPMSGVTAVPVKEPLLVRITERRHGGDTRVVPVRLSSFTPAVWCQFAESMSIVDVRTSSAGSGQVVRRSVSDLVATSSINKDGAVTSLTLSLRATVGTKEDGIVTISPTATIDPDAQVDEILIAVITRYVSDAFDRLRERPIGLVHMADAQNRPIESNGNDYRISLTKGFFESAWWANNETKPPLRGRGGRLRFLRMLVPKLYSQGGFASAATRELKDLFSSEMLAADDLNPSDAKGMIVGISQPIEWS